MFAECLVNILCFFPLSVLVYVKFKNDKVTLNIVSYRKSLAVYKAAGNLLPEAFFFPGPVDGAARTESCQTLKSPTKLNLYTFLGGKDDNTVLLDKVDKL